jgi:hypothetical protein
MIQQDFTHLKIISISLFLFLFSCSVKKQSDGKSVTINYVIKDYISEFSSNSRKNPDAILIRKSDSLKITIKDIPERASKGYLEKSVNEKNNLRVGMLCNVVYIYYADEFAADDINVKDVPSSLFEETKSTNKLVLNGKEIQISNAMMEWQPTFEIEYDLANRSKSINNHTKKVERTRSF